MHAIEAHQLEKTYGDVRAVRGISFTVPQGAIFAFLGPNGAGKTTTIKMLTTVLHPTAGTMRVAGHDPVTESDAVRRSIGIVFQDPSVDEELTAEEHLQLHAMLYGISRERRNERIPMLLQAVDLADRRNDFVKTFSGGMRRRLEIARGLLHEPTVLFLDEPTIGLDPQTRNRMWESIQELNRAHGVTVFFTTHYMEEAARVAQQIAIIDHGSIVAQGSVAELTAQTKTTSLEEAFLALTGQGIRPEEMSATDRLRMHRSMWQGKRR